MGGGAVQVFADFDDMAWDLNVPAHLHTAALVARDMVLRKNLVQPLGAISIPGVRANNDFADRQAFSGPFHTRDRTNMGYDGEVGETDCVTGEVPGPFMASAWYVFTPTTTADHDLTTDQFESPETDFDTTLGIYLDAPTLAAVMAGGVLACDDDGGGSATSYIANVPLTAGIPYAIRVDGYEGDQGTYGLKVFLS